MLPALEKKRYSGRSLAQLVLSELFLSEGKGQVYGTIHGLLQEHQENTTQLSKSHNKRKTDYECYILSVYMMMGAI